MLDPVLSQNTSLELYEDQVLDSLCSSPSSTLSSSSGLLISTFYEFDADSFLVSSPSPTLSITNVIVLKTNFNFTHLKNKTPLFPQGDREAQLQVTLRERSLFKTSIRSSNLDDLKNKV